MLLHDPGSMRECSDIPEMSKAGISLCGTELAPMHRCIRVSSVSCALLLACSYRLVCFLAGCYQSHFERIPVPAESVPALNSHAVIHSVSHDIVNLFMYSSQEFQTMGIMGDHVSA